MFVWGEIGRAAHKLALDFPEYPTTSSHDTIPAKPISF